MGYGVSLNPGHVHRGNTQNKTEAAYVYDHRVFTTGLLKDFVFGSKIGIEYVVAEAKLNFFRDNETESKYSMHLPTNVPDITHWYPFVSLYRGDDVCTISDIVRIN